MNHKPGQPHSARWQRPGMWVVGDTWDSHPGFSHPALSSSNPVTLRQRCPWREDLGCPQMSLMWEDVSPPQPWPHGCFCYPGIIAWPFMKLKHTSSQSAKPCFAYQLPENSPLPPAKCECVLGWFQSGSWAGSGNSPNRGRSHHAVLKSQI